MKKLLFLFILSVAFSLDALADVRLPDNLKPSPTATPKSEKQAQKMQMSIRVNPNISEPTLRIPRSAVQELRAQLDEIDGGTSNTAQITGISGAQTLMSGLFFSAALIFGGVWMFRGKSLGKNQKIVSGLVITAFLGASGYTIFANAAPPPFEGINAALFSDKMRSRWSGAYGTIKVEIDNGSYQGAPIQLLIPRGDEKNVKNEE